MEFETFKNEMKYVNCGFKGEPDIIVSISCGVPTYYMCPKCEENMEWKTDENER